jgi:hypothetical protein
LHFIKSFNSAFKESFSLNSTDSLSSKITDG